MAYISRRTLFTTAAAAGVAATAPAPAGNTHTSKDNIATNEAFWGEIAAQYEKPDGVIQLENGNWGVMSRPVCNAYETALRRVNREGSFYTRRGFGADARRITSQLATLLNVQPEELAFTRNATEALLSLISGYNKLRPGDHVLYADLDYDSMQNAFEWLKDRRNVEAVRISLPEPASYQGIIDAYAQALENDRKIRLILLTQVSHRTGLMIPVREIAALARHHGADVIVDAAHAWGQADFTVPDLAADFIGFNLHKWIGAPLGVGLMYIRKERMADIDPAIGAEGGKANGIYSRVHTGTMNFAAISAVEDALHFHQMCGAKNKEKRLKYLRMLWTEPLRDAKGISILTPPDPRLSVGITAFRLDGHTSAAAAAADAQTLLDRYRIFTVMRDGITGGASVRVTPYFFNTPEDMVALTRALSEMIRST